MSSSTRVFASRPSAAATWASMWNPSAIRSPSTTKPVTAISSKHGEKRETVPEADARSRRLQALRAGPGSGGRRPSPGPGSARRRRRPGPTRTVGRTCRGGFAQSNGRLVKSWSTVARAVPTNNTTMPQKIAQCMTSAKPSGESRLWKRAVFDPLDQAARLNRAEQQLADARRRPARPGPGTTCGRARRRRPAKATSTSGNQHVERDFRPVRDVPHDGPSVAPWLYPFLASTASVSAGSRSSTSTSAP